ncbi:D-ribose-binding periplasmic protein [Quillaja saponaria]|uniref:D-ribose-binding periplasmic protein n=1 Tax=Quillaja saponaria TaxID=32244 RepID=A0AAD7KPG0_QUISA|nr:D-ribose-binding periplasmic protein [Quillaja saponaria]
MRLNPGHYVSLIIPLPENHEDKTVRFTRVKLLRLNETLTLGHAYRLITTQEVMKVLRAKKYAKTKKPVQESTEKSKTVPEKQSSDSEALVAKTKTYQATGAERHRQRTVAPSMNSGGAVRSKSWQPSLQSISESSS